jgi:hypothetical protein
MSLNITATVCYICYYHFQCTSTMRCVILRLWRSFSSGITDLKHFALPARPKSTRQSSRHKRKNYIMSISMTIRSRLSPRYSPLLSSYLARSPSQCARSVPVLSQSRYIFAGIKYLMDSKSKKTEHTDKNKAAPEGIHGEYANDDSKRIVLTWISLFSRKSGTARSYFFNLMSHLDHPIRMRCITMIRRKDTLSRQ